MSDWKPPTAAAHRAQIARIRFLEKKHAPAMRLHFGELMRRLEASRRHPGARR